jgi:hypothetical protein
MTKDLNLLRVFGNVFWLATHHRVRLDVRERTGDTRLVLEQSIGSYDRFVAFYNKTLYRDLTRAVYD